MTKILQYYILKGTSKNYTYINANLLLLYATLTKLLLVESILVILTSLGEPLASPAISLAAMSLTFLKCPPLVSFVTALILLISDFMSSAQYKHNLRHLVSAI